MEDSDSSEDETDDVKAVKQEMQLNADSIKQAREEIASRLAILENYA